MTAVIHAQFADVDAFQEQMQGATRGVSMAPLGTDGFRADLSLAVLPRVALFAVDTRNFAATRSASGDLWSLTIPIEGRFRVGASNRGDFRSDSCYLLHPDRDFHYRAPERSRVLVANILSNDLQRKARALAGGAVNGPSEEISKRSPSGGALVRFVHHFWHELQQPGGLWTSPTALAETEDCLVSLLAFAASAPDHESGYTPARHAVRRAEEHLLEHLAKPVSRAEVAQVAGVSLRTLSRGFRAQHGIGPMAWLRARRLEAAHAELRAAIPGEVSVTEVAVRYGFEHLGRFSAEYLRTFGERPSETLMR